MRVLITILGGIIGALLLPFITVAFHSVLWPPVVRDGQYILVPILCAIVGAPLGGVSGLTTALKWEGRREAAGWTAVVGAGVLGAVFLLPSFFLGNGAANWLQWLGGLLFWFGPALVWGLALIATGNRLLDTE